MDPLNAIETRDLSVSIGRAKLLDRVSFVAPFGKLTAILGPNGAGKSTLLNVLAGVLAPTAGEVTLLGEPLAQWPLQRLAAHRAVLPQLSTLQFPFTVEEVVALGFRRKPAESEIRERLDEVDLSNFGNRLYPSLSGGEKQRVQLARVLAQHKTGQSPFLLLLDEPVAGLDLAHQLRTLQRARQLLSERLAVIVVLHDLNLALRYADRAVLLDRGHLMAQGHPCEVLTPERIARVFRVRASYPPFHDDSPILSITPPDHDS